MLKIVRRGSIAIFFILAGFIWFGYSGKWEGFFYHPDSIDYNGEPSYFQQVYDTHQWKNEEGLTLTGWFIPAQEKGMLVDAIGTLFFVHGNSENITYHYRLLSWLPALGLNVFLFDYRGFGQSEGIPTIEGTMKDTQSALNYLRKLPKVDPDRLIVYGQSLGGNNAIVAVSLGGKQGVKGMIIDSTFYDHSEIANRFLKGVRFFIPNKYGASQHVANLAPIPLFFLHGKNDRAIPYMHSEQLYQLASEPKYIYIAPNLGHIQTITDKTIQQKIIDFIRQCLDGE